MARPKTSDHDRGVVRPGPPARSFTQERARVTHQKLLAAAAQLFVERGVNATQAGDIADHAGVSVGAFYRYFEHKHAALVELIHLALEHNRLAQARSLREWRKRIVAGEASGRDFLEASVAGAARQIGVPDALLRTFLALSYEDEEVAALRLAYDESEHREIARFIGAVTSRERIPSPLAAARVLDLSVAEIVRWDAMAADRGGKQMRAALVDMLNRFLFK